MAASSGSADRAPQAARQGLLRAVRAATVAACRKVFAQVTIGRGWVALPLPLSAAATGDHGGGRGWLVLIVGSLVWALGYAVACLVWPFGACVRCEGTGKVRSPSGKYWRPCRRCKGSAVRLRTGRRVFNFIRSRAAK